MTTVTLEEAKANLAELLEKAAQGEPFVVAAEQGSMLRVTAQMEPAGRPKTQPSWLGGLEGRFAVPEDLKAPWREEIEQMFYGHPK